MVQISRNTKLQVLTLPGYVFYLLTALYFRISIGIFCNLFICLVFDVLLQSIYFRMFCSKHSVTFDTYLLSCDFTVMTYFTSILDPVKLSRQQITGQYFYWLEHLLILKILTVDLSYTYKCMFWVSVSSNVLYISLSFSALLIPLIFAR